jgi:hypothetical protein
MGAKKNRKTSVLSVARRLDSLAELADILDLHLPNGAEVGSLLGQMADDIRSTESNFETVQL